VEVTAELAARTRSPGRFGANCAWRRRSSRLAPWGDGGAGARSRRVACCAPIHRYLPTHSVGRRPPRERPQAEPRTAERGPGRSVRPARDGRIAWRRPPDRAVPCGERQTVGDQIRAVPGPRARSSLPGPPSPRRDLRPRSRSRAPRPSGVPRSSPTSRHRRNSETKSHTASAMSLGVHARRGPLTGSTARLTGCVPRTSTGRVRTTSADGCADAQRRCERTGARLRPGS
jgi:hypothetical protein